ncbi:MAG TPA: transglutaminaseTgpA domain-containing protein [Candidatus Limnocylindrales bacterium]|nr:transglutaminaseTgpA domain-containing protein [Candidatus Limnocylindrales bacterium]
MASSLTSPISSLPADRFYRTALFFLVLTSVITLVATGKLDIITNVLVPALVLYKGIRWWQGKPPELRHTVATRLVVAYLFVVPVDVLYVSRSLAAESANPVLYSALLGAVHFLFYVTIVRLYSMSTDRDALFLSMLSFAGVLASAVFTIDTSFLVFFLIFLLCAVAAFAGLEIRRGAAGALLPPQSPDVRSERKFYRALSLAALSVAVGAMIIGTVLFFMFPRFSAGYFARTGLQPSLMTGFSDNVELGQIGEIKKSTEVVMRVQTGSPVNYPLLRWRGIALTTFDGRRWYSSERTRQVRVPSADGWIALSTRSELEGHTAAQVQFTTLLQPLASDAIFAPANLMIVRGNFSGEGGTYYNSARRSSVSVDSTGSFSNPYRNYSQIRYQGISLLPVARPSEARSASTAYSQEMRETYLQLPPHLDPRIPALARRISSRDKNAFDKAITIESYLRSNYSYTLTLTGRPGSDPLPHFLFETKAGHCEYFASAMAVMLRTLGIPSRQVNGFLPGEYNDVAGDYIVRASDAHSWVEAYFPGSGWLTFDPTPGSPEPPAGFLSRLALYADWVQLNWNEWVINYDFSHQVSLANYAGQASTDWQNRWQKKIRRLRDRGMAQMAAWQQAHSVLRILYPAIMVFALFALRMEWLRTLLRWMGLAWQSKRPASQRNNPQLASRLYAELLRLLERRGFVRGEAQTAGEIATSLAVQPGIAPAVQEFADLYSQARFGGAPCDAFRLRALLDVVRSASRPR